MSTPATKATPKWPTKPSSNQKSALDPVVEEWGKIISEWVIRGGVWVLQALGLTAGYDVIATLYQLPLANPLHGAALLALVGILRARLQG